MHPHTLIVASTLFVSSSTAALAKDDPVLFTCDYATYSDERGLNRAEKGFQLRFMIEPRTKKSYAIGNNGSTPVKLVANADGLTFVEITDSGNVMVTAITNRGASAHSRSSMILGDLVPSQYYGTCKKS
jgi:hypothetical protein